ncbi:MAG: ArnT family glycosyltransferase [Rhodospirillales bacterium]
MTAAALVRFGGPTGGRRGFLLLLAAYALLQFALRVAVSPSLGRDDLIEAIIAQGWALGYNPTQPPLYAWLVMAANEALGHGVPAHALVKFASLYLAYAFFFLASARALGDAYLAALATLTWLVTYMFGWDVTQNYTESVLLLTMASALMYVALRLRDGAQWRDYLALGAVLGLGALTKYNFPVIAATLAAAGLFDARLRRALLDKRILASALVALLLFAPHWLWMKYGAHNFRGAFTGALQVGWKGGYWAGAAAGLVSIVRSSFDFLAPGVALWILLFWRALKPGLAAPAEGRDTRLLFDRWLMFGYAVMAGFVLFAGATTIKYHYMIMALAPAPVWLFLRVKHAGLPVDSGSWRGRAFLAVVALAVLTVLAASAWRGFAVTDRCGRCYLQWDYAGIAEKLRSAGFARGVIVADDHHVGGNLRTHFPESPMYTLRYPDFVPPNRRTGGGGQCLLIWDAAEDGVPLPDDIAGFVKIRLGVRPDEPHKSGVIEQNFRRSSKRTVKLGYALFPQGSGECR